MLSKLEIRREIRLRNNCSYLDWYVDGRRLADKLKIQDLIPPIGWLPLNIEQHYMSMLLRKSVGDLPGERVPLYVCPECADYGCGVFSCVIDRTQDGIEW